MQLCLDTICHMPEAIHRNRPCIPNIFPHVICGEDVDGLAFTCKPTRPALFSVSPRESRATLPDDVRNSYWRSEVQRVPELQFATLELLAELRRRRRVILLCMILV